MPGTAQKADSDQLGHPGTVSAVLAEIRLSGRITFARFMELALYHQQFGYYSRTDEATPETASGGRIRPNPIGWSGDYYTSSDAHPLLARALARQILQLDGLVGGPDPVTVVEMGPGKGLLAREILTALEADAPGLAARLRYILIERSPAMVAAQRSQLADWTGTPRVAWLPALSDLPAGSVTGAVLSNELVDAFPVHRIRIVDGAPQELYVAADDGRFVEQAGPLSTSLLADYLARLTDLGITLPEGYTTEVNLEALAWMRDVARVLGTGLAITIDYGHTAQDLYGPDRRRGTLLCYFRHQAAEDPYARVGLQDMTAHVDFTALAATGEEAGLRTTGFTDQLHFLTGLGAEQMLAGLEPESPELQSAIQLLRPDGMGRTFKVLVQHKGMAAPTLDGLKFQPFFGNVLTAREVNGH